MENRSPFVYYWTESLFSKSQALQTNDSNFSNFWKQIQMMSHFIFLLRTFDLVSDFRDYEFCLNI